ncbi:MAG: hypothetical protein EOM19_02390 [Candidatus Moranbacteria bacterium]|nr:hypothetical protein [Candidatus Moranbacteria bacterium]
MMQFLFSFFAIFSFIGLGWTLLFLDPEDSGWMAFISFYGNLFLFTTSFFFIVFSRKRGLYVTNYLRQSILLGLLVCLFFVLQQERWLFWWSGLLVVGAVCLIELGFLAFLPQQDRIRKIERE